MACLIFEKLFPGKVLYLSVLKQRTEAVAQSCFLKKVVYRNFSKPESLFSWSCRLRPTTLSKKKLIQMFPCEFWEIFKNIFSYRTPPVAASKCDLFYHSCFWILCEARMYTNLNINDNSRKIKLGKKEILEGKKSFKNFESNFGLKFSLRLKNYVPKICQVFQKVTYNVTFLNEVTHCS